VKGKEKRKKISFFPLIFFFLPFVGYQGKKSKSISKSLGSPIHPIHLILDPNENNSCVIIYSEINFHLPLLPLPSSSSSVMFSPKSPSISSPESSPLLDPDSPDSTERSPQLWGLNLASFEWPLGLLSSPEPASPSPIDQIPNPLPPPYIQFLSNKIGNIIASRAGELSSIHVSTFRVPAKFRVETAILLPRLGFYLESDTNRYCRVDSLRMQELCEFDIGNLWRLELVTTGTTERISVRFMYLD